MIEISTRFRWLALRAITAVLFFVGVYLLLILCGIALAALCCYGGYWLVLAYPGIFTLLAGLGLAGMGLLVFFFLIKFAFKADHRKAGMRLEVTADQAPDLMAFINTVADDVGTSRPHKLFLSGDVNAAVFFNSGFWSMFMPDKKNLIIGMGLINTSTVTELRAILAHEFGHFSQRSMRIGSYVHHMNSIIHDMLFENEGYNRLVTHWTNMGGIIALIMEIGLKIVSGIQWVLRKVHGMLNVSYLALSREMEYHADQTAAHIAGPKALIRSLLRSTLSTTSFDQLLEFYSLRVSEGCITRNLYRQHSFVIQLIANKHQLPQAFGLPVVALEDVNRYDKSKLNIKDQWASHPSLHQRIDRLESLGIDAVTENNAAAVTIFKEAEQWQEQLTADIFAQVSFDQPVREMTDADFKTAFRNDQVAQTFDPIFNAYYNDKHPDVQFDIAQTEPMASPPGFETLFGPEMIETIYTAISLQGDIAVLEQIVNKQIEVKSFDYDGQKYRGSEAAKIILQLEAEQKQLVQRIRDNDLGIYRYFQHLADVQQRRPEFDQCCLALQDMDKNYAIIVEKYQGLNAAAEFMYDDNSFEVIPQYLASLKEQEQLFRELIRDLVPKVQPENPRIREVLATLEAYMAESRVYFSGTTYHNEAVKLLNSAIVSFPLLLSMAYFQHKRALLQLFAGLENQYRSETAGGQASAAAAQKSGLEIRTA